MAEAASEKAEQPKKVKKGLIFGVLGAFILGSVAFFVTFTGILPPSSDSIAASSDQSAPNESGHGASVETSVVFVELDPLTISLGKFASARHLRFRAYLEVEPDAEEEIKHLRPRILDVLNTYLRAIAETELEEPSSMNRIRAQMLRRVQIVVGAENIRDLLITEFVLN